MHTDLELLPVAVGLGCSLSVSLLSSRHVEWLAMALEGELAELLALRESSHWKRELAGALGIGRDLTWKNFFIPKATF